ncbi:unnamed protein product [Aphis gossypii]|uniref:Uncharacterized protein n=1 Tax=Aphis gossypii TaxID=80765 RepID=A0A9P0NFS1_APHGO|nr:unnamed protein product [Aphis gossypii]
MCSVCSRGDGHPHRFIHKWVESWRTRAAGRPALFPPPSTSVDLAKAARARRDRQLRMGTTRARTHAPTHPPIVLLLLLLYSTALSSFHCHHYTLPQVRVVASGLQPLGGNVNIPKFSSALFALSISVHVLQDIDCVFNTDVRRGYRDINNI